MNPRKMLAEAVGTFILVGMGTLSIVAVGMVSGSPLLVVVPIGFGLGLMAAIAVSGHVSGGHFNSAVTLGALLDGRLSIMGAIGYVIAQVVGAIAASAVVLAISNQTAVASTKNMPGISDGGAFLVEIVLTAIFVAVYLSVTKRDAGHTIIAIPLTLLAIHAVGISFSGASVNPARALGPAIVSMDFAKIWIYLTAPFIGAVVGWFTFRMLSSED